MPDSQLRMVMQVLVFRGGQSARIWQQRTMLLAVLPASVRGGASMRRTGSCMAAHSAACMRLNGVRSKPKRM